MRCMTAIGDVPLNRKQPKRPFGPYGIDLNQAPPC
jgi:hypothetical protein